MGLLVNADELVVLMYLPGEVWYVNASIAFTGNVKGVVEELGEASVEILHGG